MDDLERLALDSAYAQMREALTLVPKPKDEQLHLVREFIGADEEGPAFDLLLAAGQAQEAPPIFWKTVRIAGEYLGVQEDCAWLSPTSLQIWLRNCVH